MGRGGKRRGAGRPRIHPRPPPKPQAAPQVSLAAITPDHWTNEHVKAEWYKCTQSIQYFCETYVQIFDKNKRRWVPFLLWPGQRATVTILARPESNEVIILKARQIGITWIVLLYALWSMLFDPIANVLLFSLRETEAVVLLDERLKGMYKRLPDWLKCKGTLTDDKRTWILSNESQARAFSTKSGDSYAGTLAVVDEADLVDNLSDMLDRIMPTIEGGGKIFLLSRAEKKTPNSYFKRLYRGAKEHKNGFTPIFLPWHVDPSLTLEWYNGKKSAALANDGCLDSVNSQYPGTDAEALAPTTLNKRFPGLWLRSVLWPKPRTLPESQTLSLLPGPLLPLAHGTRLRGKGAQIRIYRAPIKGVEYVIGADCAEGLEAGDDSAACVKRVDTGESVCHIAGKFEPKVEWPALLRALAELFLWAGILVERNHHGHSVIAGLEKTAKGATKVTLFDGPDGRPGWLMTTATKVLIFDTYAEELKGAYMTGGGAPYKGGPCIHDFAAYNQLADIDRVLLAHPGKKKGETAVDDEADAEVLANMARSLKSTPKRYFWPADEGQDGRTK